MFNKKVKTEADGGNDFEKNIKTLWIYTSLFCAFALVLILLSSIIQGKIDKRAEYYQSQYESVQSSSQSTIKNIQDENKALKADIEVYKDRAQKADELLKAEQQSLTTATEMLKNAQILIDAQENMSKGGYKTARNLLKTIDTQYLSESATAMYNRLCKTLGI